MVKYRKSILYVTRRITNPAKRDPSRPSPAKWNDDIRSIGNLANNYMSKKLRTRPWQEPNASLGLGPSEKDTALPSRTLITFLAKPGNITPRTQFPTFAKQPHLIFSEHAHRRHSHPYFTGEHSKLSQKIRVRRVHSPRSPRAVSRADDDGQQIFSRGGRQLLGRRSADEGMRCAPRRRASAQHGARDVLPMQDPDLAIKELERCKEIGMEGVQIGTHVNDWNLNDPSIFPVFEACSDLGMAVFVHPWDMMAKEKMERYWLPWLVGMPAESSLAISSMIFGGVLERLPNLRVAFAHGGGSFPATIGRIEHGFNVRPDLCAIDNDVNPKEYLGQFWIDSLVHDRKMLDYVVELFGANRVALGTDYPFPLGELEPGKLIRSTDYDEKTKELLLAGAAMQWLDTDAGRFW